MTCLFFLIPGTIYSFLVCRELIVLNATSQLNQVQCEAAAVVRKRFLSTMRSFHKLCIIPEYDRCSQVHPVCTGLVGRPSIEISNQQLLFLVEKQFSIPDMLGVSVRTVQRRM